MNPILTIGLIGWLICLPGLAHGDCQFDAAGLYGSFKKYREQINSAVKLEQLTPYFSTAFNRYYTSKLENPELLDSKTRYLTQYWDNLNTAKDIVIVYDYSVSCDTPGESAAVLTLLVVLDQPDAAAQSIVDLWNVKIHYVNEDAHWLINSMEYTKSRSRRSYHESQIVDNFVVVR